MAFTKKTALVFSWAFEITRFTGKEVLNPSYLQVTEKPSLPSSCAISESWQRMVQA